jgi:hypothetical protein
MAALTMTMQNGAQRFISSSASVDAVMQIARGEGCNVNARTSSAKRRKLGVLEKADGSARKGKH